MIRVVLDTTVLVAAVMSPSGPNAQLFDFITARRIRAYVTAEMIAEYDEVFTYGRLQHLDKRRIGRLRAALERTGIMVKSGGRLEISAHEEDNRIYECALAAK